MKKLLILLLLSTSLSAIAGSILTPNKENSRYKEENTIISEIKINDLVVIHMSTVSLWDGKNVCGSPNQSIEHIRLRGKISPDSTYVVKKLIEQIKNSPTQCSSLNEKNHRLLVILNSGGGYLADGFELGELLRKNNATTIVQSGSRCSSSCATAFLGGGFRFIEPDAELLFHAPYTERKGLNKEIVCVSSHDKLLKYMQKMINKEDGEFLYKRTMSFCSSSDGWVINDDAAKLLNIATSSTVN
jgi:ATP-dependent protease ClpP protease subunit